MADPLGAAGRGPWLGWRRPSGGAIRQGEVRTIFAPPEPVAGLGHPVSRKAGLAVTPF